MIDGALLWKLLAASLGLLVAALLWAWRRGSERRRQLWEASVPLRRAAAVILGYPQAAAWVLTTALVSPLPALMLAPAAAAFSRASWIGFFFPPLALFLINLSLVLAVAGHLIILELAVARLKGAKPALLDGTRAAAERLPALLRWALFTLGSLRAGGRNPFLLPVMIVDRLDLEPAGRRVEEFCRAHPAAVQAAAAGYAPARTAFAAAALVLCPLLVGVASLPLVPLLGFNIRLRPEAFLSYSLLVHGLALVAAAALTAAVFASTCHRLHAAALYLAAVAPGEIKARVFKQFPAAMLLPEMAPSTGEMPPPVSREDPIRGNEEAPSTLPRAGRRAERPASPYGRWEDAPASLSPALDAFSAESPAMTAAERERVRREWEEAHALKPARPARRRLPGFGAGVVFGAFAASAMLAAATLLGAHRLALRLWVLSQGQSARATVLGVRSARLIGGQACAVDLSFRHGDGRLVTATPLIPTAACDLFKPGDVVAVRYLPSRPAAAELVDDLGHTRQRAALILMVAGLAGVGIYSFLIRRL